MYYISIVLAFRLCRHLQLFDVWILCLFYEMLDDIENWDKIANFYLIQILKIGKQMPLTVTNPNINKNPHDIHDQIRLR